MPLKRSAVESSLEAKGFKKASGDHSFYIYHTKSGLKTIVRTKTSHGSGYKDISDDLVSKMAKQCKLTTKDFRNLIECPLSRDEYETKLVQQGLVDTPPESLACP